MRTFERSMTWRRKPRKLPAPALPASMKVVVPLLRREAVGVDAERGAAPIDMAVQVDEAGRDDAARGIDDLRGAIGRDVGVDRGDAAIGDGDIALRIEAGGRIDEAAALYQEIKLHWRSLQVTQWQSSQTGR